MKVEYTIKEVKPKIYAVILPDDYHRPMLFCRVQDEPANQGPWSHIALRTSEQHGGHGFGSRILRRISRRATASPATGNHHLHEDEQKALMLEAFTR